MTDNERSAVEKISKQISDLEILKSALELGDPSVTISAGALKFGKYTEKSVRMAEMTLRLVDRLIKTKWHVLAHLIGESVTITPAGQAFLKADFQFMRVSFSSNCSFTDCNFRYMYLVDPGEIRSCSFINCDFTGAIFSHKDCLPDLRSIDFTGCIFDHAMLRDADLRYTKLGNTSWDGTYLNNTQIPSKYELVIRPFKIKGRPFFI